MHISYALAAGNDANAILDLHSLLYEDDELKTAEEIESEVRLALDKKLVWEAKDGNTIIGYVLGQYFDDNHKYFPNSIFVGGLFVKSAYRNMGVGKKLMETMLEQDYPKQYTRFSVTHDAKTPELSKFYQGFGFVETGVTDAGNVMMVRIL